ncbi:transglycosylase SLT domain-containing protein [Pleionea litopenaei]|uniref:Transglycosylase SLT domain-containing protein n=1 Tax=Pleionea litopenaei TaxID=3070815 RepID=A0AA51X6I9_9GAMM|nr:transglycosylase SLT domain-containing protein [Pleionea sp. HL-JVS1]WMS86876.1 transglycosylase SLT domain-containing protein [Pleionea sp. HL-JVS1]
MLRTTLLLLVFLSSHWLLANQERPDDNFRNELKALLDEEHSFTDRFEAEVWMKDMSKRLARRAPNVPEKERFTILKLTHKYAKAYKLDPQLVLAVMEVESNFERFAISRVGARGLMQIMPFWKEEIGHPDDNLMDIETNIRYGCAILSLYIKRERKNVTNALARYNGSYGKMKYPMKVYRALRKRWKA